MKMLFRYLVYVVSFAIFGKLYAHESFSFSNVKNLFIENVGQYPSEILYSSFPTKAFALKDRIIINDIEIVFKNINENVKVKGRDMEIATFNYFKGNNPDNWKTNVVSYSKVIYENLYKNIDLIFTGLKGNKIEFQFIVKPKANVSDIAYEINCKECEIINKGKEILIKKEGREILSIENLKAYQGADEIEISFKNKGNIITYEVGKYNKNEILIIDPDLSSLLASTYLGGSGNDDRSTSIFLGGGYIYVTGYTNSSNFPITAGVYDNIPNGGYDVFISRFSSLSTLLSSTFLGGSNDDYATSIRTDQAGNVFVVGYTNSSNFPTFAGYDNSYNGGYDIFISKLSSSLSSLIASTYLGGTNNDYARSLFIDQSGNIFVSGYTNSSNFPVVSGYDNTYNGGQDAFVSKLNNSLNSLVASTYLGGSSDDYATSLLIDQSGNVYVAGYTNSSDFPTTPGVYDNSYNGGYDAFISRLNNSLSSLSASTYLGGSNNDYATSIRMDQSGNIFVAGYTTSSDFPVTAGAYDNSYNGGSDVFISKFNNSLSTLLASTFLGGSSSDYATSLLIDQIGNVYVAGYTNSWDFPTTPGAYDNSCEGCPYYPNAFISKLGDASTSVSEDKNNLTNTFKIFKNSIIFNIKTPSYIGINIYNPSGMLIKRISYGFVGIGNYEIKLNDLKKGSYILKVRIGEEVKEVKLIKQ